MALGRSGRPVRRRHDRPHLLEDRERLHVGTGITIPPGSRSPSTRRSAVDKTTVQTLANKTMTGPVVNTPTGIVKGDVGLGNLDNTSDATSSRPQATADGPWMAGAMGSPDGRTSPSSFCWGASQLR